MKKTCIALLLLISAFIAGCDAGKETVKNEEVSQKSLRGGMTYGGSISINSTENYTSLFPLEVTDAYSNLIVNNVYEGLMRINKENLAVEECLAEKMTVNDSSDEFTFVLRDDVFFHDDPCFEEGKGRKMTAEDVEYCLTMACTKMENNRQADFLIQKIKGAADFYNGKSDKVSGISINGNNKVTIKLVKSFAAFDKLLAHSGFCIFPVEAYEKYGADMKEHMVGTGPFQQGGLDNGVQVTLKKNPNYWENDEFANQLPYVDEIKINYIKDKKEEIIAFQTGKLDVLTGVPVDYIDDFMGSLKEAKLGKNKKHRYNSVNGLNVDYIGFLGTHEVFGNEDVRRAFAHAIDRKTLVEIDLEGDATEAENGMVPPMTDYDSKVNGIKYDAELAKIALKKSGYSPANFPMTTLYYNSSDGFQETIAKAIQRDVSKNLGIKLAVQANSMKDHNSLVSNSKAGIWKLGWVADYPDAENFLNLFYGGNIQDGSYLNAFKFKNEEFDGLFQEASKEQDVEKRMDLLQKCDQILMDHAVALPLLHKNVELITAAKIKNCLIDPMGSIDLKNSYIKEKKSK